MLAEQVGFWVFDLLLASSGAAFSNRCFESLYWFLTVHTWGANNMGLVRKKMWPLFFQEMRGRGGAVAAPAHCCWLTLMMGFILELLHSEGLLSGWDLYCAREKQATSVQNCHWTNRGPVTGFKIFRSLKKSWYQTHQYSKSYHSCGMSCSLESGSLRLCQVLI